MRGQIKRLIQLSRYSHCKRAPGWLIRVGVEERKIPVAGGVAWHGLVPAPSNSSNECWMSGIIERVAKWNTYWKNEFQLPVPNRNGRVCTSDATPTDVPG